MKATILFMLMLATAASAAATPLTFDRQNTKFTPDPLDMHGYEYVVLTNESTSTNQSLTPEELNGHILSDAFYSRNRMVEDMHNIKLTFETVPDAKKVAYNATLAADTRCDLALLPANQIASMVTGGFFYNLSDFSAIDLSQPWWNGAANEALKLDGKLFAALSDLTPDSLGNAYVTTFQSKELRDELYTLTREGRWTVDEMNRILREENGALDGDAMTLLQGLGGSIVSRDEEKLFTLTPAENLQSAAAKLAEAFSIQPDADPLFSVKTLSQVDGDYILPMPKLSAEQEAYLTPQSGDTPLLVMPVFVMDPDSTTTIANTLQYASWQMVNEAYFTTIAKNMERGAGEAIDISMFAYVEYARTLNPCEVVDFAGSLTDALSDKLQSGDAAIAELLEQNAVQLTAMLEKLSEYISILY